MLFYSALLLISLSLSIVVIWLYRIILSGAVVPVKRSAAKRNNKTIFEKITTQFGHISLISGSQKKAQNIRRPLSKGVTKTPWGW